jgi:hypothetical protein
MTDTLKIRGEICKILSHAEQFGAYKQYKKDGQILPAKEIIEGKYGIISSNLIKDISKSHQMNSRPSNIKLDPGICSL